MKTRMAIMSAAVAAGALVLAGCGGSDSTDDSDSVTYWSQWEKNEPQAEVLRAAIDDFTAETGIDVKVEWQGRQVMQKVQPLLRSGDVPDIVDASSSDIRATLVRAGQATDLGNLFSTQIPGEDATVGDALGDYDALISDDSLDGPFMLPTILMAQSIFYDGHAHPDLKQPQNWSDFMSTLKELKSQRGSGPIALDGDVGSYAAVWTSAALIHELGPGGLSKIASDKSGQAWKSPEARTALEHIAQLPAGDYFAPGSFGSKFPQMQERWAAGKADLLFMGSWAPQETSTSTTDNFEYRQFGFPPAGNGAFYQADVSGFAIPKSASNPDGAQKLLAWFVKQDVMQNMADKAKSLVTRPDIKPPADLADTAKLMKDRTAVRFYDGIDGDFPGYNTEVFEPVNTKLLKGDIDVDQALSQLASAQKDYWAKQA